MLRALRPAKQSAKRLVPALNLCETNFKALRAHS
jgi:hypothetical protein